MRAGLENGDTIRLTTDKTPLLLVWIFLLFFLCLCPPPLSFSRLFFFFFYDLNDPFCFVIRAFDSLRLIRGLWLKWTLKRPGGGGAFLSRLQSVLNRY